MLPVPCASRIYRHHSDPGGHHSHQPFLLAGDERAQNTLERDHQLRKKRSQAPHLSNTAQEGRNQWSPGGKPVRGPFPHLRRRRQREEHVPQVKPAQLKGGMKGAICPPLRLLAVDRARGSVTPKAERLTHSETRSFSTNWV